MFGAMEKKVKEIVEDVPKKCLGETIHVNKRNEFLSHS